MTADEDGRLAAIDQAPLILVVCEGPELRVRFASAAARAVLPGRPWRDVPIGELISDLLGQQIADAYYEVYRTGEPRYGEEWRVHLDQPDGSVHEMFANFSITPWTVAGERRGVLGVGVDVTEMVRVRTAAAVETAHLQEQYEQSRDVISALQRELLPAGLPVLPGAQIAASYLLADNDTAAGGDWFDAVARPDGRVALVVGDVVGHGVTASGVMGQLRAVLQDRLDEGDDPARALAAADRFARRLPVAHATTVCLVVLDPAAGEFSYCTAGHPAPLIVSAGGDSRRLAGTGGTPLGTTGSFPVRTGRLEIDELLLMFTDGILERPGRSHDASAAELAQVATDSAAGRVLREPGSTPAERVCNQTVELLARATGHSDDITLLAVQRLTPVRDLELDLPAVPAELRGARIAIGAWLEALGAAEPDVFVLQHALGELMTNAIEHAFETPGSATIAVRATLTTGGRVDATVTDRGRWRPPAREPLRGRGLALTAQLVDHLHVQPTAEGTEARIELQLARPARLLGPAAGPSRPVPPPSAPLLVTDLDGTHLDGTDLDGADETRVRVEGPIDAANADHLRTELLRRGRGGTVGLTVDLAGVTHLSSAGVSALHHVASRYAEQKAPLRLLAPAGSPAQVVLELVALPHESFLST